MTNQAQSLYESIVGDLTSLVTNIQNALPPKVTENTKCERELAALYFGVQELLDNLPAPPIGVDTLAAAALCVTSFFERSSTLVADLKKSPAATPSTSPLGEVICACGNTQTDALKALYYAYSNPPPGGELSFTQLQTAVDGLDTEVINKPSKFEHDVIAQLTIANKSLKALQGTGFQPTPSQMRAYTTAWFDVTKRLDATAEKKGKQGEHIASLIDIREGLSAVANRLGVLAETSVGVDIPEF